jgi:hypothetical protein
LSPYNRLRLLVWSCGEVLRNSFPRDPKAMLPALAAIIIYTVGMHWSFDENKTCVTALMGAFGLQMMLRFGDNFEPLFERMTHLAGSPFAAGVYMLVLPTGYLALMFWLASPEGCLRILSVVALVRISLLADDIHSGKFSHMRSAFAHDNYRPMDSILSRVLLLWLVAFILLTETIIGTGIPELLLAWGATMLLAQQTIERALVVTVAWYHHINK